MPGGRGDGEGPELIRVAGLKQREREAGRSKGPKKRWEVLAKVSQKGIFGAWLSLGDGVSQTRLKVR
ncbi:hypothetical protein CKAH01_02519 [Colletotrichum kahawae]|uniref:Uncharacterized protein n=1 Tax=Colletotrichum kahawae TaxID=34407 RepID=A0AAD9XXQ7_COLKA|nr:hypothetical protein CKAH01_02519 [Colletotrichum kahawae]